MRKLIRYAFIILVCAPVVCLAYQPKELMFSTQKQAESGHPIMAALKKAHAQTVLTSTKSDEVNRFIVGPAQFQQLVLNSPLPVVISIGLDNESYKKVHGVCTSLAQKVQGKVHFFSMNFKDNEWFLAHLSKQLNMNSFDLPLILFIRNGKVILPLLSGSVSEARLAFEVQKHFSS